MLAYLARSDIECWYPFSHLLLDRVLSFQLLATYVPALKRRRKNKKRLDNLKGTKKGPGDN